MQEGSALLKVRKLLGVTREELLRRCDDISIGTIRNAEKGYCLRKRSALQILSALNSFLREMRKPELTLEELKLKIS
jgi:transcriptional regulator with XRE-family HTH domain